MKRIIRYSFIVSCLCLFFAGLVYLFTNEFKEPKEYIGPCLLILSGAGFPLFILYMDNYSADEYSTDLEDVSSEDIDL